MAVSIPGRRRRPRRGAWVTLAILLAGCDVTPAWSAPVRAQEALSDQDFAALVERISEQDGYFDTDNLISNETSYLNVMDALDRLQIVGGAYVGVGPDQNFSYIARLRPEIAFITDVRRDNLLHHLLLKALIERSPTRVDFLAALHGREAPEDAAAWRSRPIEEIVDYVDQRPLEPSVASTLTEDIRTDVISYGVPLSDDDLAAIERFHQTFIRAGLDLRFTSYGRAPQWYYPTYREITLETDFDGDPASYLSTPEAYEVVRDLHLANKIIPVVGDMSGPDALREIGDVMREMEVELSAFYTSNVEFYLWRGRTFERWAANLGSLPAIDDAVIIRSYFPNAGGAHPSAVQGYYSTQTLQSVRSMLDGDFRSYWDLVTRDVLDLRPAVRR
jgi:hypothetical protein